MQRYRVISRSTRVHSNYVGQLIMLMEPSLRCKNHLLYGYWNDLSDMITNLNCRTNTKGHWTSKSLWRMPRHYHRGGTLRNPSDCPRRVCAQLLARFRLSLFRPRIKFEFEIKSWRIWKALDPKTRRILYLISSAFISAAGMIQRSCNVRGKFRWLNNRSSWRNLFSIPLQSDEITAEILSYHCTPGAIKWKRQRDS